jgi:hypothetical protein
MFPKQVKDRKGNLIYFTKERWEHILEFHQEMMDYQQLILTTLQKGNRHQDKLEPTIFKYYHPFSNLEKGNNHVVVIVKFGLDSTEKPNNFVLTAYQQFF